MKEYIERDTAAAFAYNCGAIFVSNRLSNKNAFPAADVEPVRHGRCDVCSGKAVLTQDTDNGYSLEIDSEKKEASLWHGDNCLAVFRIDFCPACGSRMDGGQDG